MPMCLSAEREAELMEQNMPKIYRAVDNFTARCSKHVVRVPYEDFVQEASIAFLEYIRSCESEDQLEHFPWFSATQAMTQLVLSYQPMSCPKRTGSFREFVSAMPYTVSYDVHMPTIAGVDGMSKHWVDDKDTMMDFEMFLESLPDYADRVIGMRLYGLSSRKIAGQLGVTESAISQRLKRYASQYHDFIKEDDQNA